MMKLSVSIHVAGTIVVADQRLLRAAQAEGLTIFNPETGTRAQLEELLS